MSSLVTRVSPVIDGAPELIGDGVSRVRAIRIDSGYTPPLYLRADSSVRGVYRIDALPFELVLPIGRAELLSGDPSAVPSGNNYFVSDAGSSSNSGTIASPWSLTYAFAGAGGVIAPGDTIWIRGGTYVGTFSVTCNDGVAGNRIVFRQYGGDAPLGERVRIDGEIQIKREYIDVRGLEVFQTDPNATLISGIILGSDTTSTKGSRVINCIVHDCGEQGCTGWLNARGSMYYGVISYNNGTHHNKDHGFYNHDQEKVFEQCISFNNLARGFQSYDSVRDQKHITFRQLIAFGNGSISTIVNADCNFNLKVLAPRMADDIQMDTCVGYHAAAIGKSRQLRLGTDGNIAPPGWLQGQVTTAIRNCYFWRARHTVEVAQWQQLVFEDNTIISTSDTSDIVNFIASGSIWTSWERNVWYMDPALLKWTYKFRRDFANWQSAIGVGATDTASAATPPTRYWIWANQFEPGRGHLAICNHDLLDEVPVSLDGVVTIGDAYEIRNVQDLWGAAVVSGVYDGSPINVPMAGIAAPVPGGASRVFATPPVTGPEFNAFVVLTV